MTDIGGVVKVPAVPAAHVQVIEPAVDVSIEAAFLQYVPSTALTLTTSAARARAPCQTIMPGARRDRTYRRASANTQAEDARPEFRCQSAIYIRARPEIANRRQLDGPKMERRGPAGAERDTAADMVSLSRLRSTVESRRSAESSARSSETPQSRIDGIEHAISRIRSSLQRSRVTADRLRTRCIDTGVNERSIEPQLCLSGFWEHVRSIKQPANEPRHPILVRRSPEARRSHCPAWTRAGLPPVCPNERTERSGSAAALDALRADSECADSY